MTPHFNIITTGEKNSLITYSPNTPEEVTLVEAGGALIFNFKDAITGRPVIVNMSQEILQKLTEKIL